MIKVLIAEDEEGSYTVSQMLFHGKIWVVKLLD